MGTGFYKMFKGWISYYKRKPKVEGDFDYYKIMFYLEQKTATLPVSEGVNSLLKFIEDNPGRRAPYIAKSLNVPQKTLERWLKKLKSNERVAYKGSTKTGGYYLAD